MPDCVACDKPDHAIMHKRGHKHLLPIQAAGDASGIRRTGECEMKTGTRLLRQEISRMCASCQYGMERWKSMLLLMVLLTLLSGLALNEPASDALMLRLLHWLGKDCRWCSVMPF